MDSVAVFQEENPSLENYWRSVVLFGNNVASYKFALAKTLLELIEQDKTHITLEELAKPYSKHLCEHIAVSSKQATSRTSSFLDACRQYNEGAISADNLIQVTKSKGFNNVLDAFHHVNGADLPVKFFEKTNINGTAGIVLTDDVYRLGEIKFEKNLTHEAEARWNLVETAWNLGVSVNTLSIKYDDKSDLLFVEDNKIRRRNITSVRAALNGYQKGKCFYCFDDINVTNDSTNSCDVDHFIPHTLQQYTNANLDGVWNLVLSCEKCNRGDNGKFAKVPALKYLERLSKRNDFLISSHHPLRETLMNQTGRTEAERHLFLQSMYKKAKEYLIHTWETTEVQQAIF